MIVQEPGNEMIVQEPGFLDVSHRKGTFLLYVCMERNILTTTCCAMQAKKQSIKHSNYSSNWNEKISH